MKTKTSGIIFLVMGLLLISIFDHPFINFFAAVFIIAGSLILLNSRKAEKRKLKQQLEEVFNNTTNAQTSSELEFSIKGMNYTNAKTLLDDYFITEGTRLEVKPELNNSYDKNAMLVLYKGEKIGYVEKECAELVKQFYNKGYKICYVDKVKRYDDNYFVLVTMPFK